MPQNKFQSTVYTLLTVAITVISFVFYSIYVVHGSEIMEAHQTTSVLAAINTQGGEYMFGTIIPLWAVALIECVFAFTLSNLMGRPCAIKLASKFFNPKTDNPKLVEAATTCATVALMCPTMSLISSIAYYPFYNGFNFIHLIAEWLKLVCFNFPFAFFTQLFFIQPLVRTIFKAIFVKKNTAVAH